MKIEKVWKLVNDDLQVSISRANYTSWIKKLSLKSITEVGEGRVIADIACPSTFLLEIIERRFYGQISEALGRVVEKSVELRFTVDASMQSSKTESAGPLFAFEEVVEGRDFNIALSRVGLREDFTLDSFAVSSSNELAHAAAMAVAEKPGTAYNPLFIYGGVGVGKTHLMQAVGHEILKKDVKTNMIYCAGEEFTNEIIAAIQQKRTTEFKKRYRSVKTLLIDDIQFIAGKTTVQEEFFHTFNAILKGGGQVVMTSDRPPSEIRALEDRLRSRFEAGLIVDIGQPNFELRTAIVLIKARQKGIDLEMEGAQVVAANIESARQIEGFLMKLLTESRFKHKQIDMALIRVLLGKSAEATETAPPPLRPMEVVRGVADYYAIPTKLIRGTQRQAKLVLPRHVAMYLLRIDFKIPLEDIGDIFSGRDHTSIMHAVDKITNELKDSEGLRVSVEQVRQRLYGRG